MDSTVAFVFALIPAYLCISLPSDFVLSKISRYENLLPSVSESDAQVCSTELFKTGEPNTYYYSDLYIWDPEFQFPMYFKHGIPCSCGESMLRNGWTTNKNRGPRRMESLQGEFSLVSRIYKCSCCSAVCIGWETAVTTLLPKDTIPFLVTHKCVFHKSIINLMRPLIEAGLSFAAAEKAFSSIKRDWYLTRKARYFNDINRWSITHVEFMPVIPFPEPNTVTIGKKMLISIFLYDFELKYKFYVDDMCLKPATILTMDHTFKSAVNIGYKRSEDSHWTKQYTSLFLVLNEKKQVLAWQLCKSESFSEVENLLACLKTRLELQQQTLSDIYIDNCCSWKRLLQSVFGSTVRVKLDLFHAVQRLTIYLSKRHIFYGECLQDIRLILRSESDTDDQRSQPTPDASVLIDRLDRFHKKWIGIDSNEGPVINLKFQKERNKLKAHIQKGCLSNIPVGAGTQGNERLHESLNSYVKSYRTLGPFLAFALIMTFLHLHNLKHSENTFHSPQYCEPVEQHYCTHFGIGYKRKEELTVEFGTEVSSLNDTRCEMGLSTDSLPEALLNRLTAYAKIESELNHKIGAESLLYSELVCILSQLLPDETDSTPPSLKEYGMSVVKMPPDGDCFFHMVKFNLEQIFSFCSDDVKCRLQEIGLTHENINVKILRKILVHEWLSYQEEYQGYLKNSTIEEDAPSFLCSGIFDKELGDCMFLGMANALSIPIVVFKSYAHFPVIVVMPTRNVCFVNCCIYCVYTNNESHYDAAIIDKTGTKDLKEMKQPETVDVVTNKRTDTRCRCGQTSNGQDFKPRCTMGRCPCRSAGVDCLPCTCVNCSNPYGSRNPKTNTNYQKQTRKRKIPSVSSNQLSSESFINNRQEHIADGTWSHEETVLLHLLIIERKTGESEDHFQSLFYLFNELVKTCGNLYNHFLLREKSEKQFRSKLTSINRSLEILNGKATKALYERYGK